MLRKTITTWEELSAHFVQTFDFQDVDAEVCNALHIIRDIVEKITPVAYPVDPHENWFVQSMMMCYNLSREPKDDE